MLQEKPISLLIDVQKKLREKGPGYAEYRKLRDEAQELTIARRNIESLYEAEQKETKEHQKEKQH